MNTDKASNRKFTDCGIRSVKSVCSIPHFLVLVMIPPIRVNRCNPWLIPSDCFLN